MPPSSPPPETGFHSPPASSPVSEAGKVARQHAHDVRNQLNSLELGMTLIEELTSADEDLISTMNRMRQGFAMIEASLKSLVRRFAEPRPMYVPASELAKMWQAGLTPLLPSNQAVEWTPSAPEMTFWLDPAGVGALITDLVLTFSRRSGGRPVRIHFRSQIGNEPAVELREPPQDLPLSREFLEDFAAQIVRHGGQFEYARDDCSGEWTCLLTFPSPATSPASSTIRNAP